MRLWALIFVLAVTLTSGISLALTTSASCDNDDQLYSQFVTIKGSVTSTDPATHKTSTPVGTALVFQRVGCKGCLVVAVTDENGEYKLRVGRGRYRVIVRNCGLPNQSYDCVAPNQPRIVNADNTILDNVFNIKLVRPTTPLDITLPSSPNTKSP